MAPQQNSTLIDENLEVYPSTLNIPEEINRYSPILPPKDKKSCNKIYNNHYNNYCYDHQDVNFIVKWGHMEREPRHYHKYKQSNDGHSHRSRSISLHGVNNTLEQSHKEITIWLDDEPRYVSGVINKTTCNDIIKALIDDEISNGNYIYFQRNKDGTASRDYSNYVITECWCGIERSYNGNMAILPVWNAWSRVHNEMRLILKHRKSTQDPTKVLKTNTTLSSIRNYINKLFSFGKSKKRNTKSKNCNKTANNINDDIGPKKDKKKTNLKTDKLRNHVTKCSQLFPMDPNSHHFESNVKKSYIKEKFEESENKTKTKLKTEKLYKLSETRSSIRKRRSIGRRKGKKSKIEKRCEINFENNNNFIRKRKSSTIRSSVRNKLAQKSAEMNELYEREYALTKELTNKCKIYKLHNELYTSSDKNLELSVGQIQRCIEACAKEIIQTEHELLEVKNEIKQDISIINNLKRLTLESDLHECDVPPNNAEKDFKQQNVLVPNEMNPEDKQMQFVDNIYEFCDNNASMLV